MTMDEKYVVECPHCGKVEGYLPNDMDDRDVAPGEGDTEIIEQTFEIPHATERVQCPQCGRWLSPDRVHPE